MVQHGRCARLATCALRCADSERSSQASSQATNKKSTHTANEAHRANEDEPSRLPDFYTGGGGSWCDAEK